MVGAADMYGRRTGHFILHWGVPREIHVVKPLQGRKLAILEFGPRGNRKESILATNGMSEHVQKAAGRTWRTELFATFTEVKPWMIEFMGALAGYPVAHDTALADFDTIPIEPKTTPLPPSVGGIMFVPPWGNKTSGVGVIPWEDGPENAVVLQIVGFSPAELEVVEAGGSRSLFETMLTEKRSLALC